MNPAPWVATWESVAGLPDGTPQWVVASVALICTYLFVILPSGAFKGYIERKFTAGVQARVGPNRAGPKGILQPIVDLLKLLQKDVLGSRSWKEGFWLGVHTMALYSTVAVLPLSSLALLIDTDMSAFLPLWAALVLALGTMLLGLNQGSISGWFGGIRVAAQTLAASFPALIAVLAVGVRAGGFRWSELAQAQSFSPLAWSAFSDPFQFLGFCIFLVSGLVLLSVPPLDGGLSIRDIHGGVSSHLHGRRLSLFRLGNFYGFFLWSVIAVVLFLGAWNLPETLTSILREYDAEWLVQALELGWMLSKTFGLMLLVEWVAKANPRLRVDQITDLTWKVLSPLSLVALTGAALWSAWKELW